MLDSVVSTSTYFVPIQVSDVGTHTVKFWAMDNAGNKESLRTVTFGVLATYTLVYASGGHGTVVGTSPQTVTSGSSGATVTAVPGTGYHFVSWSDGVTTASRIDTGVVDDITVAASFVQTTKVTITSNHTSVVHKHPVAFSGTVSSNLAKNTHVAVYVLRPGTTTWVLLSTRHTTSTHRWTYTYSPSTKGTWYFQARYAGSSKYAASTSSSRKIAVK